MRFCQCGAQPSYPHAQDCPFPYFGEAPAQVEKWEKAKQKLFNRHPRKDKPMQAVELVQVNLIKSEVIFITADYTRRPARRLPTQRLFNLLCTLNSAQERGHCEIWARADGVIATRTK
jgi:hypothetical protein